MFTPSNQKKLTNISIISLKKYNRLYCIAVYPNKLYEYYNKITDLKDVITNETIYKNAQGGVKCSREDLAQFNLPIIDIIREIVDTGHEQKNVVTREYENEMTEIQIANIVRKKVLRDGKFLSLSEMRQLIRKIYKIKTGDIKRQTLDIINILVKEGYERIKMKILVNEKEVFIDSNEFKKFREECKKKNIGYIVKKNIINNEEELL